MKLNAEEEEGTYAFVSDRKWFVVAVLSFHKGNTLVCTMMARLEQQAVSGNSYTTVDFVTFLNLILPFSNSDFLITIALMW